MYLRVRDSTRHVGTSRTEGGLSVGKTPKPRGGGEQGLLDAGGGLVPRRAGASTGERAGISSSCRGHLRGDADASRARCGPAGRRSRGRSEEPGRERGGRALGRDPPPCRSQSPWRSRVFQRPEPSSRRVVGRKRDLPRCSGAGTSVAGPNRRGPSNPLRAGDRGVAGLLALLRDREGVRWPGGGRNRSGVTRAGLRVTSARSGPSPKVLGELGAASLRQDVLVHAKDVVGVVLPLDLDEPLIVRAVVRPHPVLIVRVQEVHVATLL